MRRDLSKILSELSTTEFIELHDCIKIANNVRLLKDGLGLSDSQLSLELDVDISDIRGYLNGGYEYTVKDISKIKALKKRLIKTKQ